MNASESLASVSDDLSIPSIDPNIFRAYDVRGVVDENLTTEVVYAIGRAFGSEIREKSENLTTAIGRDGRESSTDYLKALSVGLRHSGVNVVNFGLVPTPIVHYGAINCGVGATVVVTGSHNPPTYNGLKFSLNGLPFAGKQLGRLRHRLKRSALQLGAGRQTYQDVVDDYIAEVAVQTQLAKPLRIVIDCGNGAAGVLSRRLFEAIGCEVHMLYEEVDSTFPNHHPDPAVPANLLDLRKAVVEQKADAGIAFDGDGDRVGVVTESGESIWADRLLALFAQDILRSQPSSSIVFDVKCGAVVRETILRHRGRLVISPTGHTNIKERVNAHRAALGGEFSGHFCFPDRWYPIDDAAYAATRFLELVSRSEKASDLLVSIKSYPATPEILLPVADELKFDIVDRLRRCASFRGGKVNTIDGVRVDFDDGWGLVRASNTSPKLSLRFEAHTQDALDRIQDLFKRELESIEPDLVKQPWL